MTFRGIIVSENLHRTDDSDTRCVGRNEDNALLLVCVGVGRVALSHKDVHSGTGITSSANPPEDKEVSTSKPLKYQ